MAVRITHTNNSSGHDDTYVYRSTSTMDPQNLPAPIADAPPVALGATFEYIDNGTGLEDYYYRTQDHEGGQVSAVSAEVSVSLTPDYATAQVGDEIGGGIYAGTYQYGDGRTFHIIVGKASSVLSASPWGYSGTVTGATDLDDGRANSDTIIALGGSGPVDHCEAYSTNGVADWYLPSKNEQLHYRLAFDAGHPEFQSGNYEWSSYEQSATTAWSMIVGGGGNSGTAKTSTSTDTRPIRRVPV